MNNARERFNEGSAFLYVDRKQRISVQHSQRKYTQDVNDASEGLKVGLESPCINVDRPSIPSPSTGPGKSSENLFSVHFDG